MAQKGEPITSGNRSAQSVIFQDREGGRKGRDTSRTTSIQDPSMAKKKLTATNPYNGLISRWLLREGTDARTAGEGTLRSRGRFFSHRFFPFLPFSTLAQRRSRSTFPLPPSFRSFSFAHDERVHFCESVGASGGAGEGWWWWTKYDALKSFGR